MAQQIHIENVRTLVQDASLEMTGKDVEALHEAASFIPQGTRINVTFLGNEDLDMRVAAAKAVKELDLIPVPHISARRLQSEDELKEFLQALADVDATKYVFAVGGDPSEPMGPYGSSLEMIQSGILKDFGVQEVSIAGYPEGHPDISDEVLDRELKGKLNELARQNLGARILTQFGFDADPIVTWLQEMAADEISAPVGIGVPGPAGIKRLLTYARRFGATTSASIVKKYGFSLTNLVGSAGPDKFIGNLAEGIATTDYHGDIGVHFYTFGGVARTAEWLEYFKNKL